ncbi:MAG: hypothetical protein WD875_16660 [Pirellulales bacterium]
MFARSLRKLLSVACVAAAAFVAVNLASPTQARADHRSHGHNSHGQSQGNYYRGPHGGAGYYSHQNYYSGYNRNSFRVQIAPPIYNYGPGYGYNCAPSYGYGSYVRPGLSLHFGF